jgi:hypothetical protein
VNNDAIFIISMDGVHCQIQELRVQPDAAWYSHKHHCAGVTCELDIVICSDYLVWINGPMQSSMHDLRVLRGSNVVGEGSLKDLMPPSKMIIGDCGYIGETDVVSTHNTFDAPKVKILKMSA